MFFLNNNIFLQVVTSAGDGLSVADGSVRIMMQALQYDSENRMIAAFSIHGKRTDDDMPQAVAQDLEIRLDTKFELTREQSVCHFICGCFYKFNKPPHRPISGSFHNRWSTTTRVQRLNRYIWMSWLVLEIINAFSSSSWFLLNLSLGNRQKSDRNQSNIACPMFSDNLQERLYSQAW